MSSDRGGKPRLWFFKTNRRIRKNEKGINNAVTAHRSSKAMTLLISYLEELGFTVSINHNKVLWYV